MKPRVLSYPGRALSIVHSPDCVTPSGRIGAEPRCPQQYRLAQARGPAARAASDHRFAVRLLIPPESLTSVLELCAEFPSRFGIDIRRLGRRRAVAIGTPRVRKPTSPDACPVARVLPEGGSTLWVPRRVTVSTRLSARRRVALAGCSPLRQGHALRALRCPSVGQRPAFS